MLFRSAMFLAVTIAMFTFSTASAYTVQDVAGGGSISGKITFSGTAPEPTKFPIEKNPEVCGAGVREVQEVTVDGSGGLQHVVVFIKEIGAGKEWNVTENGWELNQKTCIFIPWVSVIPDKSELTVFNNDPVLHNVHAYELIPNGPNMVRVTMFNEAQPTQGDFFKKPVRMRRGNTIKVECDAHNFMHAYILALKNPYYAITAADGSYSIDNIPPGKYSVTVWHSMLGSQTREVEVASGATADLSHQFSK